MKARHVIVCHPSVEAEGLRFTPYLMPWGGKKYSNKVVVAGEQVRSSWEAEKQILIATIRKVVEQATGGKLKVDEHHDVHLDQLTFTATLTPDEFGPIMY